MAAFSQFAWHCQSFLVWRKALVAKLVAFAYWFFHSVLSETSVVTQVTSQVATLGGVCGLWLPCIAIVYTLYSIYVLYVLRRHCRVLVWNRSTTCTISSLLHQILRVSYMLFFCLAEILAELLILMSLVHLLSVFLLLSQRLPIFASSFVAVRSAIRWVYQQHCWLIYYISSS